MYTVSAVIPAYDAENSIIQCLDSIVNQTYPVHEIIVIDDGSTDNTVVLIENFIINHSFPVIKLIRQENAGPSAARNLGIKNSSGDFIAFLDSDDQWLPEKTMLQMDIFMKDNEVILVSCLCGHRLNLKTESEVVIVNLRTLMAGNLFSTPTVIVRKDLLIKTSFDQSQKYSEDYGLWLKLAGAGKCILLNKVLVTLDDKPIYGQRGLSARLWKMEKGELRNYRVIYQLGLIGFGELCFFSLFSFLKYIKRELVSRKFLVK